MTGTPETNQESGGVRSAFWRLLPLAVFAIVALFFGYALMHGDPSKLPSTFIGRQAPATEFAPLEGLVVSGNAVPGFDSAALASGEPVIVNFFASWCLPCVEEHPQLVALAAQTGVKLYGVNYKDAPEAARRFLGRYGNPYAAVGVDPAGRGAIEWGVYGMPETFVVDGTGKIAFKQVGPISPAILESKILPAIEAAMAAAPPSPQP